MGITPEHYMQHCLALAEQAQAKGEVPIAAVVVCQNEIIAQGYNQPISQCDPTAHAEIIALRAAAKARKNYRLLDCDLYVTLEPCAMCAGAMIHARIRRCYFGAYDPKSSATAVFASPLTHKLNHQIAVEGGIMQQQCEQLLKNFFRQRR